MKRWAFSRCALASCVVVVLLAGCGAAQPQIATTGATPQSRAIATHAGRGGSWMLPKAKKDDLLYVSSPGQGIVYVFRYPGGQPDGMLTYSPYPYGLCSDKHGNVFVVSWSSESGPGSILEYAHGASQPIATLKDGDNTPAQCSVDSNTGNLAAGNLNFNIAVWANAQGSRNIIRLKASSRKIGRSRTTPGETSISPVCAIARDKHGSPRGARPLPASTFQEMVSIGLMADI